MLCFLLCILPWQQYKVIELTQSEEDHHLVLCVMKLVQEVNQVAVLDLGLEPVQSSNFICNQECIRKRERPALPFQQLQINMFTLAGMSRYRWSSSSTVATLVKTQRQLHHYN